MGSALAVEQLDDQRLGQGEIRRARHEHAGALASDERALAQPRGEYLEQLDRLATERPCFGLRVEGRLGERTIADEDFAEELDRDGKVDSLALQRLLQLAGQAGREVAGELADQEGLEDVGVAEL